MSKIKKNFFYISAYNLLTMILPLIVSPILSRRLGAESLGIYTYVDSVVSIFVAFASTGVYRFGMREIAKVRDNKDELSQTFIDIWFNNACNVLTVILIYLIFVFSVISEYKIYFLIRTGAFLVCLFDTAFLYCGLENMKQVTIRDAIAKGLTFVLVITFIRSTDDLIFYFVIMTGGTLYGVVAGFLYGRKYIELKKPCIKNCIRLYKPMVILLIPVLSSNIYHSMDKIMIGYFGVAEDVGYYELASKALIPRTIINAFGTAMCPHLTALYSSGKKKEADRKFHNTFMVSLVMSYAFMFGICAIAKEFAPVFWGEGFEKCSSLMIGLSISIPIWAVGEVIRSQYLLPNSRDNEYSKTFVAGMIVNAVFNILLIPSGGAFGAIVATLMAETSMSTYQIFLIKKEIAIMKYIVKSAPYFISGIIMVVIVRFMANRFLFVSIYGLFLEVMAGGMSFVMMIILYEVLSKKRFLISFLSEQCRR